MQKIEQGFISLFKIYVISVLKGIFKELKGRMDASVPPPACSFDNFIILALIIQVSHDCMLQGYYPLPAPILATIEGNLTQNVIL